MKGFGSVDGSVEDDREFVSTGSGHGVGSADAAAEDLGNSLQKQISHVVTHGVIDLLEAVQVENQESRLGSGTPGPFQSDGQPVLEEPAVGQPGEDVVKGEM